MLGSSGWSAAPRFLVRAPELPATVIERPGLQGLIRRRLAQHRVVVVSAPAGSGKTSAISEWAARSTATVAWLTLGDLDSEPTRLFGGLVSALRAATGGSIEDRLLLPMELESEDRDGHAALWEAILTHVDEVVLVIDDIHLAGPALPGSVVGQLVSDSPPNLRIMLIGRRPPDLALERLRLGGAVGDIDADDLAFSSEEIVAVAAAVGAPIDVREAAAIRSYTQGWPVAVRLALVSPDPDLTETRRSSAAGTSLALSNYLIEEVLDQLPPELSEFVLCATTSDWIDQPLALALAGPGAAGLLQDCLRRGLPLQAYGLRNGTPVYRWHSLWATQCRFIVRQRNPQRADELYRAAANALLGTDPVEAVNCALHGHAYAWAVEAIKSHWLNVLLAGRGEDLETVCLRLPRPWSHDPNILGIRAACRREESSTVAELQERAANAAGSLPDADRREFELTTTLTAFFVADRHADLAAACDRIAEELHYATAMPPSLQACALFCLGWTELRLRRSGAVAVSRLREAVAACEAEGYPDIARRARANLGWALAFGGDLVGALAASPVRTELGHAPDWQSGDTGVEWFTLAFIDYWRHDLEAAALGFRRVINLDGTTSSFTTLARIWLVLTAVASGAPPLMAEAEAGLASVVDEEVQGLPWGTYKTMVAACLADARGDRAAALRLVQEIHADTAVPVTSVFCAEISRRCGDLPTARRHLDELPLARASFVDAMAAVTEALIADRTGSPAQAHSWLERALAEAVPQQVVQPFVARDGDLLRLLRHHLTWGTAYEDTVAAIIRTAEQEAGQALRQDWNLTARELDILNLMRTHLTGADIGARLFISINTVKTHQRAIYRKLGAEGRADALRIAMVRGIG